MRDVSSILGPISANGMRLLHFAVAWKPGLSGADC
jgi:hypothetical protein